MASPRFFVVGCPRSGTTLLQRMLDAHPELTVTNDTHFIPRAVESVLGDASVPDLAAIERATPALIEWSRSYHRFPRLGLAEEEVERSAGAAGNFVDFVCALYQRIAQVRGARWAAEKTPDYVRRLPLLHALFPWVRFVHIVRDGRDVALSLRSWAKGVKGPGRLPFWQEDPLGVSALWWRWQVETGRRDRQKLPADRVLEVAYEELVRSPETVLRRIVRFLELPFRAEMLRFHVGRERRGEGLDAKRAWLPPTPGVRDWRTQLTATEMELFEALAGDLNQELGYERATLQPSDETAARAFELARRWQEYREHRARSHAVV